MNRPFFSLIFLFIATLSSLQCQDFTKYRVDSQVDLKASPFRLSDVRILKDNPFYHAMEVNAKYLLELEPDRLLHRWRKNAGLEPKAPIYGGWEQNSSHMLGHYLSACAMMYAASGEEEFLRRTNYIVNELALYQAQRGTGYVGGIPNEDTIFDEVAAGNIRSGGFDLNGGWVPWYMLHKVWDGLIDAYLYCDNEQAKEVVVKMSDWVDQKLKDLDEGKFQEMLEAEFGGMNESLAEVYAITGDKKYLDLAYRFEHKKVIDPLAKGIDEIGGLHANTQIPKILGNARLYELTGSKRDSAVASFFWYTVTDHHSYVNGGNSNFEYFSQKDQLATQLSTNTSETCNTYNMLKLTNYQFRWEPQAQYADYYELALYNHILASQQPETGMFCYYVALESGKQKKFSTPFDSFWCCVGTGIENHVKYGEGIYFQGNEGALYVNLFIPSELSWKENDVTITQRTSFPYEDKTVIEIRQGKGRFPMKIRYPQWASNGIQVTVNGQQLDIQKNTPGSYITIDRKWKSGDMVEVQFPMSLYTEPIPGNEKKQAILYGPVLLSGELGNEELMALEIPVLVTNDRPVNEWVRAEKEDKLTFKTLSAAKPADVNLIPFFEMYDQNHMVYWDLFTEKEWLNQKEAYQKELARIRDVEARTVDILRLGEMQPERDHKVHGENTGIGEYGGKKFRDAPNGGWFAFEMECDPNTSVELHATYYGSDAGNRRFTIMVDGEKIASEHLQGKQPRKFIDYVYPIPKELTRGKKTISIKFEALPGNVAGAVYTCRLVRKSK